jgi:hypothetical protein
MLKALRNRLTYANVIATLALFIALGGTSFAVSKIDGSDIRKRSLTGQQFKSNSIGSREIKERSLGPVPRAKNSARLAGQPAAHYLVRCPEGMVPVSDVCFETQPRPPLPYGSAAVACEGTDNKVHPGRRLPTHDELMTAIGDFNMQLAPGGELTSNVYPSSTTPGAPLNVLYIIGGAGSAAITPDTAEGAKSFRCVADPVN